MYLDETAAAPPVAKRPSPHVATPAAPVVVPASLPVASDDAWQMEAVCCLGAWPMRNVEGY